MGIVDNLMTRPATIITRTRTGSADEHNVPLIVTSTVETTCYIEQIGAEEAIAGRETEVGDLRGFFPAATVFDGSDAVTVDGTTYELVGAPAIWADPFLGGTDHVEVLMREVSG